MGETCFICGQEEDVEIHKQETCGENFGEEILLAYMKPGQGLRRICQLKKGHPEEHAMEVFGDTSRRVPHGFITWEQINEGFGC